MVSRKEAERVQEESYKSDPRTALQRAIEQRAKHIQLVVSKFKINNIIVKQVKYIITEKTKLHLSSKE